MKTLIFSAVLFPILFVGVVSGQTYYFPPLTGNTWAVTTPEELGWCTDKIPALYDYLDDQETKAFIVLVNGEIVLEKYFGTFTADSVWYWASAGKTLTSFLVGLAQEEGKLNINDPTSKYLGKGWTSLPEDKENKITVWNQLTMTSGLDDGVGDPFCTNPDCLVYKADAGTRWAYHNGPYTLLDDVITEATGQNLNAFGASRLLAKTGMSGLFIRSGFNNVFYSKPRTMAKFGSLILNKGKWNGTDVMKDKDYLHASVTSSQNLNPSYGYLWWLNGQVKAMLPGSQVVFNRELFAEAPDDMYSALGKNGQILNIIPSLNMVMVRMGNFNSSLPVPFLLNDEIWKRFNEIACVTSVQDSENTSENIHVYPNPAVDHLILPAVSMENTKVRVILSDVAGRNVLETEYLSNQPYLWNVPALASGWYSIRIQSPEGVIGTRKIYIQQGL